MKGVKCPINDDRQYETSIWGFTVAKIGSENSLTLFGGNYRMNMLEINTPLNGCVGCTQEWGSQSADPDLGGQIEIPSRRQRSVSGRT